MSALGGFAQLGPDDLPIRWAELAARDDLSGFALDRSSEFGAARPEAIHDVSDVADGASAALGERFALGFIAQGFDEGFEFHSAYYTKRCGYCQHQPVSAPVFTLGMKNDERLIRLANLQRLCSEREWGPKELRERIGGAFSLSADLIKGTKPSFGEKLARRIEPLIGVPRGWLDSGGEVPAEPEVPEAVRNFTPEQIDAAILIGRLDPQDQQEILRDLSAMVERHDRIAERALKSHGIKDFASAGQVAHIPAAPAGSPKSRSLVGGGMEALTGKTKPKAKRKASSK